MKSVSPSLERYRGEFMYGQIRGDREVAGHCTTTSLARVAPPDPSDPAARSAAVLHLEDTSWCGPMARPQNPKGIKKKQ